MHKLYKITNTMNEKLYIGITKLSLSERWAKHIRQANDPKYPLHRAMRKYGIENFSISLIEENNDRVYISSLEEPTIKQFDSRNNGYNVALGGYGGDLGPEANEKRKITIASKTTEEKQAISEKLSKVRLGRQATTETKLRLSQLQKLRGGYGPKVHSTETKTKMSLASRGKNKSQTAKQRMSESAIENKNCLRFGIRASCLCCHRNWDIGNFVQHIKRNEK